MSDVQRPTPKAFAHRGGQAEQAFNCECRSQRELIVIFVRADPEPIVMTSPLASQSAIAPTNFGRVNAAFLAEA